MTAPAPHCVSTSKGRVAAWWAAAAALAGWVAVHFTLVLLFVLPLNPISQGLGGMVNAYVVPLYIQSWLLFAPNPSALDRDAYTRAICLDEGKETTTAWIGLTGPLIETVRANRLASEHASLIVLLNAIYSLTNDPRVLSADPTVRQRVIDEWADLPRQPPGLVALERAGSAAVAAAYPNLDCRQVQVMLTIRPLPRFEERHAAEPGAPASSLEFRPVPFQSVARWSPAR